MDGGSNSNSSQPGPSTTSHPALGIDGQPIKAQGPARLGQSCVRIPTPPETDPLWTVLVTLANRRLEEVLKGASPGLGAGADVLSRRGDCEPGSYCDFSQTAAVVNDGGRGEVGRGEGGIERVGVCKEQLPDYHECTSYFECLSLQCGNMDSVWIASKAGTSNLHLTKPGHEKHHRGIAAAVAQTGPSGKPASSWLHPRNVVNVCVPARRDSGANGSGLVHGGGGMGGGGGGGAHNRLVGKSMFPAWKAALIAVLALAATVLVLVLVRRRKRLQARKELEQQQRQQQQLLLQKARFMGEGRDRSPTVSGEFCWTGHDTEKAGVQDVKEMDAQAPGGSWFHKWVGRALAYRQRSEGRKKDCQEGQAPLSLDPDSRSSSSSQTVASIAQVPSSDSVLESEGPERATGSLVDLEGVDLESNSASSTAVQESSASSSPRETIVVPFEALAESASGFGHPADVPESSSNLLWVSGSSGRSARFYPTMNVVSGVLSASSASSSPRLSRLSVSRLGSGISSIFPTRSSRSSGLKVVSVSPISPVSTGMGDASRLSSRNSYQAGRSLSRRT
ncbi:unnamed protein product [Mortierella alpina]